MLVSFEFCFFNIALQLQMEEPCILSLAWISFTLGWVRKRLLVEWKKKVYLVLSWTFIFKWRNQIELFYTIEKAFLANQELSSNPLQSGGKTFWVSQSWWVELQSQLTAWDNHDTVIMRSGYWYCDTLFLILYRFKSKLETELLEQCEAWTFGSKRLFIHPLISLFKTLAVLSITHWKQ